MSTIKDIGRISLIFMVIVTALSGLYFEWVIERITPNKHHKVELTD